MKPNIEIRNEIKRKKPEFRRQNVNRNPGFEGSWRRPRGIHSKLRRGFRGKWNMPAVGYSSPRDSRGLSRSGLKLFVVSNLKQLENIGKDSCIVISSTVGMKKKIIILHEAKLKGISVHAIKNTDKFLDDAKVAFDKRKGEKKIVKNKREQAKKEAEKKKEEKNIQDKSKPEAEVNGSKK